MRRSLAIVIMAMLVAATAVAAQEKAPVEKDAVKKAVMPEGFNAQTTCPVMGNKITETSHVDYQGQRVYFCCPACEGTFLEDPDKYFEQAAKDRIMFENVQTACPVTGKPIDEKFFIYHKGRGIYFCCADAMEKFKAEPEKYLKEMRAAEMKVQGKALEGCQGKAHEGCKGKDKGNAPGSDCGR